MTDDRVASTVRSFGGKVQEGVGKVTGDAKTEVQGVMSQATGAVQEAYGKTVDAAMDGAQTVKDVAVAGHDFLKTFVEDNPHTAVAVALGIGLFVGYTAHRPAAAKLVGLRYAMSNRNQEQGFDRAMGEAKKQASHVADAATTAARKTAGSFETAAREIIENQPYTAVGIALAVGWLLGRMHRPL